jgi:outer membrane protein assembly factor BamB
MHKMLPCLAKESTRWRVFLYISSVLPMRILSLSVALLLTCASLAPLQAENWGQWRGPSYSGTSPEKGLPTEWSAEKGIKWKTRLPGQSGATPVVWGDSVFVSSPDADKNLQLLCLDRKGGAIRWQKTVVEVGNMEKGRGNAASPSPATDGKAVYVMYSTGDVAAFDFQGEKLWHRKLGEEYGRLGFMWLYGASPLIFQGRLYIQVLQRSPVPADYPGVNGAGGDRESYLLALDPATGKNLWKHTRTTTARVESMESYATPVPHQGTDGKWQLLVAGGDCLTGHNPETGEELWRGYGFNRKRGEFMRLVASPLSMGDLALVCGAKKEQAIAFRTDLKGDITETGVAWTFDEKKTPDVCTPALYRGKVIVLDGDSQTLTCLDPKTGEKKWQGNLGDRTVVRSSPTVADGKVYILNEKGTVIVCSAGDEFQVLKTIPMGDADGTRSCIAVSDGQLFIRTTENLYCVE